MERATAENEKLGARCFEVESLLSESESERSLLRKDIRELKQRESRILQDVTDLEDENVNLQKQVLSLKQAQVEYEAVKHERTRLQDEVNQLRMEGEELIQLRAIVEQNLEEALKTLQYERDQKHMMKKELDRARSEHENYATFSALASQLSLDSGNGTDSSSDGPQVGHLFSEVHTSEVRQLQQQLELAQSERTKLRSQLDEVQSQLENKNRELNSLQKSNEKLKDYKKMEEKLHNLEKNLNDVIFSEKKARSCISKTTDDMEKVCELLGQLYHHVSEVLGLTPDRVMLDHVQKRRKMVKSNSTESASVNGEDSYTDEENSLELTSTLIDQVQHIEKAVHRVLEEVSNSKMTTSMQANDSEDVTELKEEIVKLKAMLSSKREQVATLRSVLKANKQTAEAALSNLKRKYDNEKAVVAETIIRLRTELKALKQDAATFASLRAMFAQRCDEYVTQLDELARQVAAAEEEKKTLNSLLRMAIQQKLSLTQKLEDMEFDKEKRRIGRVVPTTITHGLQPGSSSSSRSSRH